MDGEWKSAKEWGAEQKPRAKSPRASEAACKFLFEKMRDVTAGEFMPVKREGRTWSVRIGTPWPFHHGGTRCGAGRHRNTPKSVLAI